MTVYQPGIESDLLLLNWWAVMGQCEDLERAFSVTLAPIGAFMESMRKCTLLYEADADGIWFAAWYDHMLSAGFYGLWVRADKRHNRYGLKPTIESLHWGLERFPVIIITTMNEHIIERAEGVGFQPMGAIPHLFDGEPASIAWLDSAHFYPAIEKYAGLFENVATNGAEVVHG